MQNGQFNATAAAAGWTSFCTVNGGEFDGTPVVILALKAADDGRELGPFAMTLANAVEVRRILDIAIDQAIHERRLIEEGT